MAVATLGLPHLGCCDIRAMVTLGRIRAVLILGLKVMVTLGLLYSMAMVTLWLW